MLVLEGPKPRFVHGSSTLVGSRKEEKSGGGRIWLEWRKNDMWDPSYEDFNFEESIGLLLSLAIFLFLARL
jgi:hypothetical protein